MKHHEVGGVVLSVLGSVVLVAAAIASVGYGSEWFWRIGFEVGATGLAMTLSGLYSIRDGRHNLAVRTIWTVLLVSAPLGARNVVVELVATYDYTAVLLLSLVTLVLSFALVGSTAFDVVGFLIGRIAGERRKAS